MEQFENLSDLFESVFTGKTKLVDAGNIAGETFGIAKTKFFHGVGKVIKRVGYIPIPENRLDELSGAIKNEISLNFVGFEKPIDSRG